MSETANGSLNQMWFLGDQDSFCLTWITVVILELIHAKMAIRKGGLRLLDQNQRSQDQKFDDSG